MIYLAIFQTHSDISNSQPLSENASSRVDKKERDPQELESKNCAEETNVSIPPVLSQSRKR